MLWLFKRICMLVCCLVWVVVVVYEHVYVWVCIHVQEGWMRTLGVLLHHSLPCDFKTMYLTVPGIRMKTSNSQRQSSPHLSQC